MSVGIGTPGSGKSTFTTFLAYQIARHEEVRVGFLAFETHPHRTRDHLSRLACGKAWQDLPARQQVEVAGILDRSFRVVHRTFDAGPYNNGQGQGNGGGDGSNAGGNGTATTARTRATVVAMAAMPAATTPATTAKKATAKATVRAR